VYSIARPWPCGGPCCTQHDCSCDCAHGTVTGPGGQTVPLRPGRAAQWPARACDVGPQRAQGTTAQLGPGRTLTIREEEPCQQQRRAQLQTKRGRASLRKRTAVEHAMAHHVAHQGRRARYKGLRKKQCDGRRQAA
jgi:Transposase DDE domain